jgi:hypothetical protein
MQRLLSRQIALEALVPHSPSIFGASLRAIARDGIAAGRLPVILPRRARGLRLRHNLSAERPADRVARCRVRSQEFRRRWSAPSAPDRSCNPANGVPCITVAGGIKRRGFWANFRPVILSTRLSGIARGTARRCYTERLPRTGPLSGPDEGACLCSRASRPHAKTHLSSLNELQQ